MAWIPLHVHSQYSILDSSASVNVLAAKAKEYGISALALTDQGNLYGAVEFIKACKGQGVKPILGCELYVAPGSRNEKKRIPDLQSGYPIILLAKNKQGYQHLCKLSSLAHIEGFYYTPRIDKELLENFHEGLICLLGSTPSRLAQYILQNQEQESIEEVCWYKKLFKDDCYFELQRHEMKEEDIHRDGMDKEPWLYQNYVDYIKNQEKIERKLRALAQEFEIRCVATNDSHYIAREDWKAHEILMNIQSGEPVEIWEKDSFGNPKNRVLNPKRQVVFSHEFYFKTPAEMKERFADFPEAISTSLEIADKCIFEMDFKTKYYPVYIPPHLEGQQISKEERVIEAEKFLRQLCDDGIKNRYTSERLAKVAELYPGKLSLDVVKERLNYELDIITSKGMCDYLLIVYDFIAWAKNHGIPMGPGRGSGVGSIILYLIGITDIEPLRFHLFFERFINPERLSYPDIDVDICMERRSEVIEYTMHKYGKDKVAQIITFGTMKAKMAIKDVGRVLSVPLAKVNSIAKLVPEDPNMTLEKAFEADPELRQLYETDDEVRTLIDIAKKLEGSVRNTGIHAAGLIIGGDPIMDLIPVCNPKDSDLLATQFSMKPVEAVGMLKIDFLGLKTLTSIQKAVDAIQNTQSLTIDWINLPLEDKTTFDLLNQGKTLGTFQLESPGMQDLAKQLHIDKFEEIIAVGSLYRPGPMEMIPSFIQRKHRKEVIEIDHPLMKDILAETYGIMVYQEQVMQIASRLAGYTLGEGDVLRRAMGKKDKEEMARQREKFRIGALQNQIEESTSMHIFDKVEKFASYGFNKSHAAAYAYLTYVTAFLKANYPKEWMAALMTSDRDDISKLAKMIRECQAMGIAILPPDINESGKEFAAATKGIRFAMTGIKGVGEGVVDAIIEERKRGGLYKSLYDFFKRIDTRKVGKKVVEVLIEAGCFDFTGWLREALIESVDSMYVVAAKEQKESERGIMNLFALIEEGQECRFSKPPEVKEKLSKQKILKRENELLGFYLTGHPLDEFQAHLQRLSCVRLQHLIERNENGVFRAAFIINSAEVRLSAKTQRKFSILMISDGGERLELPIWPDLFEEKGHLIVENQLIYAVIQTEKQEEELKLQCRWFDDLTKVDQTMIEACDRAYDRAKMQSKMASFKEKGHQDGGGKSSFSKNKEFKKNIMAKLHLKIHADQVRFSHILELKKLFRSFPGDTKIHIEFLAPKGKLGIVEIDSAWGVEFNQRLEEFLRQIQGIQELHWEKN